MSFSYAPLLLIAWTVYFFGSQRSNWWLLFLIAATIFFINRIRGDLKRTAAANNAVFAAATFQTLSPSEQAAVEQKAVAIISRLGRPVNGPDMMVHTARWGWYALAMHELEIKPIGDLPRWNIVPNPLLALTPNHPYLWSTINRLQKAGHPVDVTLFQD